MRIVPGSHQGASILPHLETYDSNNLLARGQTIEQVDESNLVYLEVDAGEFSIHHNKTIHSSQPNTSDTPRIGFVAVERGAHLGVGRERDGDAGPGPVRSLAARSQAEAGFRSRLPRRTR